MARRSRPPAGDARRRGAPTRGPGAQRPRTAQATRSAIPPRLAELLRPRGTLSDKQLVELETIVGALPPAYRALLAATNGGPLAEHAVTLHEGRQHVALEYLFGVSRRRADDILGNRAVYAGRIPDGTLAIGAATGGNLFVLGLTGRSKGRVYFFDHEHEDDDDPWAPLTEIAASLGDFALQLGAPLVVDVSGVEHVEVVVSDVCHGEAWISTRLAALLATMK